MVYEMLNLVYYAFAGILFISILEIKNNNLYI